MKYTLKEIIASEIHLLVPEDQKDNIVTSITADSRKVKQDTIFCAIHGEKSNGFDFVPKAIDAGAKVIICEMDHPYLPAMSDYSDVLFIPVPCPRYHLSYILSQIHAPFPDYIGAVTGTNGKTSVAEFIRQILLLDGVKAASMGTLGVNKQGEIQDLTHTTADPEILYPLISDLKKDGYEHLILEASSHGLAQNRLHGLSFMAGAFTNLSHDHLDYHKNMENYARAKQILWDDLVQANGAAIINLDDENASYMLEAAKRSSLKCITYGKDPKADIKIIAQSLESWGQNVTLSINNKQYPLKFPLCGGFQLHNALAALGVSAVMLGRDMTMLLPFLEKLSPVRGRMEYIGSLNGAGVYIDYAHTPDALKVILKALRPHTAQKLSVVFGCGGNRDQEKRPIMAKIAEDFADDVIVTDDNPRDEDPLVITQHIQAGFDNKDKHSYIQDRREAILTALQKLSKGDILVVAGKGHEQGQEIKGKKYSFCDKKTIINLLKDRF